MVLLRKTLIEDSSKEASLRIKTKGRRLLTKEEVERCIRSNPLMRHVYNSDKKGISISS